MYTSINFKTKKELVQALKDGKQVSVYQPNDMFGTPTANRSVALEGPHVSATASLVCNSDHQRRVVHCARHGEVEKFDHESKHILYNRTQRSRCVASSTGSAPAGYVYNAEVAVRHLRKHFVVGKNLPTREAAELVAQQVIQPMLDEVKATI